MMYTRDRIISKTQQYWIKNHKYGLIVLKTVEEVVDIGQENGNNL